MIAYTAKTEQPIELMILSLITEDISIDMMTKIEPIYPTDFYNCIIFHSFPSLSKFIVNFQERNDRLYFPSDHLEIKIICNRCFESTERQRVFQFSGTFHRRRVYEKRNVSLV